MAGILFPDFMGSLSKAASFENARAQSDWLDEDRAAKKVAGGFVQGALAGDKDAQTKLAAAHPDTFLKIQPFLAQADANKRAKVKEDAEYITSTGMAILNAPPEQQAQIYARVRQEAAANGRDVSQWPTTYDPGWIKFNVDKAMPVAEYYKRNQDAPQAMPAPGGGATVPAGGGNRAGNAISGIESAGRYDAVGPVANSKGQRAYGRYQIMDFNVGPWTQEVLGQSMTPQQFLANPQAQDAVFNAKFSQYEKQYGSPQAAARAWFAGPGGMNNPGATDVLGTTVQAYGDKFAQAYGPGATGPGPQVAQGDNTRADGSGTPLPPAQQAPGAPDGADIDGIRRQLIASGGDLFTDPKTKQLEMQNGYYVVRSLQNPRQILRLIPAPTKPKEAGADKGLFGDSIVGRALTVLRTTDPSTQEYAAAYALLSKPQVIPDGLGGQTVVQPMNMSMFAKPAFPGGSAFAPMPAGPTPAGGPQPTAIPGGGTIQNIPGKGKGLDNSARDELTKASGGVLELTELVKSFDPSFGGFMFDTLGDADNLRKRNFPDALGGKDEKGQAQWWQRYQQFANLERNKLFGAALTPGEAAEFNKAMVSPGMKPDEIRANLSRQRDVASKALSRIVNSMVASGYNAQAIEAATGIPVGELPSAIGGVPQAAPTSSQRPTPQAPQVGAADKGRLIFEAKKAIQEGRDPNGVRQKLKSLGVDPSELDKAE